MFLTILLNFSLIFTVTSAIDCVNSKDCWSDYVLSPNIYPVQYNIILSPYADTFHGESSIFLQLLTTTSYIGLHVNKLQIEDESVMLVAKNDNTVRTPQAYSYCKDTQILLLEFGHKIYRGEYTLNMKFSGSLLGTTGFVAINRTDHKGQTRQSYVTLFGLNDTRRAFPCWDGPMWKSKFNISVVHPNTHRAWSNMPQLENLYLADDKIWTNFKTTPNLPAQFLIIVVIDAVRINILYDDTPHLVWDKINIWCTSERKYQVEVMRAAIPKIVNFLSEKMDITSRKLVIDLIAFPNLPTKFVEGWGLVIVREKDVIDKGNFIGYEIEVQRTIAYAIIQQFTATFSDGTTWFVERLTKGLTLYLSYYILEESHLYDQMTDLFVTQIQQPALHNDIILNVPRITNNYDPFYTSLINNRASVSMRMLQHVIQKKEFNEDIAKFLNLDHDSYDWWQFLQQEIFVSQYNLEFIMDKWMLQTSYPVLTFVEYQNDYGTYVSQYFYPSRNNDKIDGWYTPLTYTTQQELDFSNTLPKIWLADKVIKINGTSPTEWIIFNILQTYFYRVSYNNGNWFYIAHYLNENDHTNIHRLNRAQLIDDAYHFMIIQEMNNIAFLQLIEYLWKEMDYVPWHSMSNILHYTSPFFNFPDSGDFKNHVLEIFAKYMRTYEYDIKPPAEATSLLIHHWACKFGNFKCREMATNMLIQHLKNTKENPIKPGWENWVYCAGLMNANISVWHQAAWYFVTNKKEMIEHLSCTEDDMVIKYFLNSIMNNMNSKWEYLKPGQLMKLYRSVIKKHARKKEVVNYILDHFEQLMSSHMDINEKLGSIIMNIYSRCQLNQVWEFTTSRYKRNIPLLNTIRSMIEWQEDQIEMQKVIFLGPFRVTAQPDCKLIT